MLPEARLPGPIDPYEGAMESKEPLRGPISSSSGRGDVDVDAAGMVGVSEDCWAMEAVEAITQG